MLRLVLTHNGGEGSNPLPCRRRAVYAAQAVKVEPAKVAEVVEIAKPHKDGKSCPKCGRHFARGLHLHTRACKG